MNLKMLKEIPPWDWPEEAGKIILEVLTDDRAEPSDRALAVGMAGDLVVINDEIAAALLAIIQDGSWPEELRGDAAIALGPVLEQADIDGFDDLDDFPMVPNDIPISEGVFHEIEKTLHSLYMDTEVPKHVRRRILEASVRAPQAWHQDAVRSAFFSNDEDWRLTAVFSMRWIHGFDDQILESLESDNPDIHYQAVCAAGDMEVDAAWEHVAGIVRSEETDRPLLLAAIEAAASVSPQEAATVLAELITHEDEEIVEAAHEAMAMAAILSGVEFDDDEFSH